MIHIAEIEDFLSPQECDNIILMAETQGLQRSMTLGESNDKAEVAVNKTLARVLPDDPLDSFHEVDVNSDGHLDSKEVTLTPLPLQLYSYVICN